MSKRRRVRTTKDTPEKKANRNTKVKRTKHLAAMEKDRRYHARMCAT